MSESQTLTTLGATVLGSLSSKFFFFCGRFSGEKAERRTDRVMAGDRSAPKCVWRWPAKLWAPLNRRIKTNRSWVLEGVRSPRKPKFSWGLETLGERGKIRYIRC